MSLDSHSTLLEIENLNFPSSPQLLFSAKNIIPWSFLITFCSFLITLCSFQPMASHPYIPSYLRTCGQNKQYLLLNVRLREPVLMIGLTINPSELTNIAIYIYIFPPFYQYIYIYIFMKFHKRKCKYNQEHRSFWVQHALF